MNTDPNLAAITVIDERPTKKPTPKPPKKPLSATQAGKPQNRKPKGQ